LTAKEKPNC